MTLLRKSWLGLALGFCIALAACDNSPQTGIVVEWTTATEINSAGFNLYRSDQAEGPYTKINDQLIPASTDPLRGGKYQYADRDVLTARVYYYTLEDVDRDGTTTLHGPIQAGAVAIPGVSVTGLLAGAGALGVIGLAAFAAYWWWKSRMYVEDRHNAGK